MVDETSSQYLEMPQFDVDKLIGMYAIVNYISKTKEEILKDIESSLKNEAERSYKDFIEEKVTQRPFSFRTRRVKFIECRERSNEESLYNHLNDKRRGDLNSLFSGDLKELCELLCDYCNDDLTYMTVYDNLYNVIKGVKDLDNKLRLPDNSISKSKQLKTTQDTIDYYISEAIEEINKFNEYFDLVYEVADRLNVFSEQDSEGVPDVSKKTKKEFEICLTECNAQLKNLQIHRDTDDLIEYVETLDTYLNDFLKNMKHIKFTYKNFSETLKESTRDLLSSKLGNDKIQAWCEESLTDKEYKMVFN
ncbi:MAG: hypothetical protein GQ477_00570 [Nanohaloarchaea archaeon]|nr:hypothetical protein [Candidatus Nanohaloarchaea archaeon]